MLLQPVSKVCVLKDPFACSRFCLTDIASVFRVAGDEGIEDFIFCGFVLA
jgi:hypothetical protein